MIRADTYARSAQDYMMERGIDQTDWITCGYNDKIVTWLEEYDDDNLYIVSHKPITAEIGRYKEELITAHKDILQPLIDRCVATYCKVQGDNYR